MVPCLIESSLDAVIGEAASGHFVQSSSDNIVFSNGENVITY